MPAKQSSHYFKSLILIFCVVLVGGIVFLYSGIYPMGADTKHNKLTCWILETLRERSVARASKDLQVPEDLDSSSRLLAGGADYNDMCTGCHLKPGQTPTDLSQGLYPAPPNLTKTHDHHKAETHSLAQKRFWIIKHGIKASGMPAWGSGHDDDRIWNMVAFLHRLPELTPEQYQILTARGDKDQGHH